MSKTALLLSTTEDTEEMLSLLATLDIKVVRGVIQKRAVPHRTSYLGPGRISEVAEEIGGLDVDIVVVNGILRPSQHHALEMLLKKECVDRVGVILRIFAEHAHTAEGKKQVALATLRYELPFLREWIHKAKSGERPGFLSGGAYATEVYYEHARSHIRRIEKELESRALQRDLRRKRRRNEGFLLVSLAGYTNAGKSALLNALCDTEVMVDGRLFSTLSTTTRRLRGPRRKILLTDTVGFIKDLPPDLVNAFNATLEEIFLADVILVVVDVSESTETVNVKMRTSMDIILPRLEEQVVIIVGNKVDLLSATQRNELLEGLTRSAGGSKCLLVSAQTGQGLDDVLEAMDMVVERSHCFSAALPLTDDAYSFVSALHDIADVRQLAEATEVHIIVSCSEHNRQKIEAGIVAVGGRVTSSRLACEDAQTR